MARTQTTSVKTTLNFPSWFQFELRPHLLDPWLRLRSLDAVQTFFY